MSKRQAGQAFILVLILLAVGATLVVPALRLTGTSLKSSQIVTRQARLLYAADAMQEYVMWKLLYDTSWRTANLSVEGVSANLTLDLCGVSVNAIIVMRAVEGKGGVTLATDDLIKPTKTVEPSTGAGPYTYIIKLEQLSNNTTQGLDAVYDVLPKGLNYVPGTSKLRVDGGNWTDGIGEPSTYTTASQNRLRWPATLGTYFSSPMRVFNIRQVKEIQFQVTGSLGPNEKAYNWVLLKLGTINTLSGPTAPITKGSGANPTGGLIQASKASDPEIIMPGEETPIKYTLTITNLQGETDQIQSITDYLPPEFYYTNNTSSPPSPNPSGITTANPQQTVVNINGVDRQKLVWNFSPQISLSSMETKTLVFWAKTTKEVSGSYYNEFTVLPVNPIPNIFQPPDMSVTIDDFNTTYSWNSGAVTVPAYDSSANAGGVIIDANLALLGASSISITSYQVR